MRAESRADLVSFRRAIVSPLAAWTLVVVVVTVLIWHLPNWHTVYMLYAEAGRNWTQGLCSYECNGILSSRGYRYSPPVTVMFALFGTLPDAIGGILWRWLGVALMVSGYAHASRRIYSHSPSSTPAERQWPWLLILPLCAANLFNGQVNLHMLGLILIGVAAVRSERWNVAAVCLAATCFLKIYPISLALLLVVIFPSRLGPRFAIALAVGAALPFLAQSTGYVMEEYRTWFRILAEDDRFGAGRPEYRDLSLLLYNLGLPITRAQFLIVDATTGAAAALVCIWTRWRLGWTAERLVPLAYALGTFWMLLCGPATESSTYILVAPLAAWLVVDALNGRMSVLCRVLVVAGAVLVHVALISSAFPFGRAVHELGLQPLGALVMAIGYSIDRFGFAFGRIGATPISPAAAAGDLAWGPPR